MHSDRVQAIPHAACQMARENAVDSLSDITSPDRDAHRASTPMMDRSARLQPISPRAMSPEARALIGIVPSPVTERETLRDVASAQGYLSTIVGPMFSGKSSLMVSSVERHYRAKKRCIIIKHAFDHREEQGAIDGADSLSIQTHAGHVHKMVPVIYVSDLASREAEDAFNRNEVIGIDEIQFFAMYDQEKASAVITILEKWVSLGKIIVCSGLDLDWRREPFALLEHLVGRSHYVTKLMAVCMKCGADALFSARTISDDVQYQNPVGGNDKYEALCRRCYITAERSAAK